MQPLTETPIAPFHPYLSFDSPWYFNETPIVIQQTSPRETPFTPKVFDMLPQRYTQSAAPSMRRIEVNNDGSKSAPTEREWKRALREKRDMEKQSDYQMKLLNRRNKFEPMKAEPIKRNKKYEHVKSKVDTNLQFDEGRRIPSPGRREASPKSHYRTSSEPLRASVSHQIEKSSPRNENPKSESSEGRTRSAVIWRPGATINSEKTKTYEENVNSRRVVSAHPSYSNGNVASSKPPSNGFKNNYNMKPANALQEHSSTVKTANHEPSEGVKHSRPHSYRTVEESPVSRPHSYRTADESSVSRPHSYRTGNESSVSIAVDISNRSRPPSYRNYNNSAATNSVASVDVNESKSDKSSNDISKDTSRNTNSTYLADSLFETYNPTYYQNHYSQQANESHSEPAVNTSGQDNYKSDIYVSYFPSLGSSKPKTDSPPIEVSKNAERDSSMQYKYENTTPMESRSLSLPNLRSASGSTYYYKLRHQGQDSNVKATEREKQPENDHQRRENLTATSTYPTNQSTSILSNENLSSRSQNGLKEQSNEPKDSFQYPRSLSYARKYLHDSIDFNTLVPVDFEPNKSKLSESRYLSKSEMSLTSSSEAANRMYSWLDSLLVNQFKKESPTNEQKPWSKQLEKQPRQQSSRNHNKLKNVSASMPANLNYAGLTSRSILKKKKKVNISLEHNRIHLYTPEYDMPMIRWPGTSYS